METIELKGTSYVTARAIEACYQLTHKKVWQMLKVANLPFEKAFNFHVYEATAAKTYFDNFITDYPKYNKINHAK